MDLDVLDICGTLPLKSAPYCMEHPYIETELVNANFFSCMYLSRWLPNLLLQEEMDNHSVLTNFISKNKELSLPVQQTIRGVEQWDKEGLIFEFARGFSSWLRPLRTFYGWLLDRQHDHTNRQIENKKFWRIFLFHHYLIHYSTLASCTKKRILFDYYSTYAQEL